MGSSRWFNDEHVTRAMKREGIMQMCNVNDENDDESSEIEDKKQVEKMEKAMLENQENARKSADGFLNKCRGIKMNMLMNMMRMMLHANNHCLDP